VAWAVIQTDLGNFHFIYLSVDEKYFSPRHIQTFLFWK
jgi:hypothetical protein